MRKIFCFTDSLLEVYRKDFERDTHKFFRASKLEMHHLGSKFEHKGSEYELIGKIDDKDVVCKKDDGTVWAMDRITVQRYIIGETNVQFQSNRKLRKLEKDEQ